MMKSLIQNYMNKDNDCRSHFIMEFILHSKKKKKKDLMKEIYGETTFLEALMRYYKDLEIFLVER